MHYNTYDPSPELNPVIKCYWTIDSPREETPQKQRIVPDGCMEMIFHYGDLYKQYIDGQGVIQPRACVFGQLTAPLEIEPTGITGIFSVRFHPEGFMPFATIPIKAFENKAVSLETVFGEEGIQLESRVLGTKNTEEKIKIVEAFLLDKLAHKDTRDRIVSAALSTILEGNGQLSVEELSLQMSINRRQLERRFADTIGLSPKQLSKIIRLQAALKLLLSKQYNRLTDLAYEGDYYDQAHFIKDFKEFTGLSPKDFYNENSKMSALFHGSD
ncbi:AraC family transcriptional regulator [Taibaiella sp. KBW10]|uniref:helix-turn-helix domain-containing protein n=1 Tax=Taibaiella sp. KBW10 TaxID=2153357 RepID=UPI000F5A28A9|nr:helix-turn-helix domain-containing protein [Taibaiella sp. KBW10]RQO31480.1 AraC family transcriptional regulator [Taibaiella sp. KBW10]